jgi:putative transposase
MKYANQLWQADTMFGPYVNTAASTSSRKQAKLIAFIDDARFCASVGRWIVAADLDE